MGSDLRNILKGFCANTRWKYAIFWKLKFLPSPVLMWEDAFCDSMGDHSLNDRLGLCVAEMSSQVYSPGEGIVGKVAATGDYKWIQAKDLQRSSWHCIELSNGSLAQFSAGIRTVIFVGIAPFGVIQLGSLEAVAEDTKFVGLVREALFAIQLQNSQISMGGDYVANGFEKPPSISSNISPNRWNTELLNNSPRSDSKTIPQTLESFYAPNSNAKADFEDSNGNPRIIESGSSSLTARKRDPECEHDTLTIFSAGYELHEALGPDFMKRYVHCSDQRAAESEVVVSNACHSDVLSEKSVGPLLAEQGAKLGSLKQEWSTSTEPCGASFSAFNEAAKSKKRAKAGENCRQRPRDRQLIQDRIKELREIVPNGSKCSIDSLLERTINHMLFLEGITKHAEKLNRCAESRKNQKETSDQGSSWAVEVGGLFKVSSVLVENLNKSGQMLVEMVCDECSYFLEISEAIRGLGLTILKGVTEGQGEKTWICFVVEGHNNQTMHRRDVLCSLVQALKSKASL